MEFQVSFVSKIAGNKEINVYSKTCDLSSVFRDELLDSLWNFEVMIVISF